MDRHFTSALLLCSALCAALPAQTQTLRIVGSGYRPPQPLKVAPGQVLTLFLEAGGVSLSAPVKAGSTPLPLNLEGFSAFLRQTFSEGPIQVPVFSVEPARNCYGLVPSLCTDLVAMTIQIPWELIPNTPRAARPENFATLTVSHQGLARETVALDPQTDQIHIVNTCDFAWPLLIERPADPAAGCRPMVTHAGGRLVTPSNPAVPGETLIMYAFGLGEPPGAPPSGHSARSPIALAGVELRLQEGVNLPAVRPGAPVSSVRAPAASAELVPGNVGLYQISFTVGGLDVSIPACTASSIASNLTVSIGRASSFDGAGICVQTQIE